VAASGQLEPGDGVDGARVGLSDPADVARHDLDAATDHRPHLGTQPGDRRGDERPADDQDDRAGTGRRPQRGATVEM
jgi:hypothetical protein